MAVAIVNWNTRDHLRACLQSVFTDPPAEVVVVDNGSQDGSADMVRRDFPQVMLEVLPNNPGYGAGANWALARCTAPYVLLLNSDTVIPDGVREALTAHLDRHPRCGIVGPRLLNPDGTLQKSGFPFPSPFVPLFKRPPFAAVARMTPALRGKFGPFNHDRAQPVPWVIGAALGIRRDAFAAIGGFDEGFIMYFEEVDLCYRLHSAGWETHFTPATEVVHVGGASTRQRRMEMIVRLSLSSVEFYRRHHQGWQLALGLGFLRATTLGRLMRDAVRYRLSSAGSSRDRLAEDLAVWREVLVRSSRAL